MNAIVRGAEQVTRIFGRWPSFHDAEVVRLTLDRAPAAEGAEGPTLTADVYVFEMTSAVAPDGTYVLRHETLIAFRFLELDQLTLGDFNQQNALWDLSIADVEVLGVHPWRPGPGGRTL